MPPTVENPWRIRVYRDHEDEQIHIDVRVPSPLRPGPLVVTCPKGGAEFARRVLTLAQDALKHWRGPMKARIEEEAS